MTVTESFMTALQTAESSGNTDDLVGLFAPDATLSNLTDRMWSGEGGAREFWQMYLAQFADARSEFSRHSEDGGLGVMEWETTGHLKGGQEITYRGVSLIELGGEKVKAFRTYYDSAAFVTAPEEGGQ